MRVSTLAENARDLSSITALGVIFSIFITPYDFNNHVWVILSTVIQYKLRMISTTTKSCIAQAHLSSQYLKESVVF